MLPVVQHRLEGGDAAAARRLVSALLPHYPYVAQLHYFLGMALWQQDDHVAAEPWLARAARYNPFHVLALATLGTCRLRRGDTAGAARAWRRALALHPDVEPVRLELTRLRTGR